MQAKNKSRVKTIGLDFGSTTSSAMVAVAGMGESSATGRMAFGDPEIVFRSEPQFTPFKGENIDEARVAELLDLWLAQADDIDLPLFSGGAIITGLAARKQNAGAIARLVRERIGQAVVATVDDPNLESWLAFMGCTAILSRHHRTRPFINLDIGGGTTNPAAGLSGQVYRAGCFYIGARHFRFVPGTYVLEGISSFGRTLVSHLGVSVQRGDILSSRDRDRILDFFMEALEAMITPGSGFFSHDVHAQFRQTPFDLGDESLNPAITFSGGVGELMYSIAGGHGVPGTTHYGDLGIDFARRILESEVFSPHVSRFIPEHMGRATVYGLTLYNTEISGATLFLPDPSLLPLSDIPIAARLGMACSEDELNRAVRLAKAAGKCACIQMSAQEGEDTPSAARIRTLGLSLSRALAGWDDAPLVVLVPGNIGKALGNYATGWGNMPRPVIILDEIPDRNAHFVNIGRPVNHLVPVSFYGIH